MNDYSLNRQARLAYGVLLLLPLFHLQAETLQPGEALPLSAVVRDQFGQVMESPPALNWQAEGGTLRQEVGPETEFTAGTQLQDVEVKASLPSGLTTQKEIKVRSAPVAEVSYADWRAKVFAAHPLGVHGPHTASSFVPFANGLTNFEYYAYGLDITDENAQRPFQM